MFNFFDSDKNPFMVMMNRMAASSADAGEKDAGETPSGFGFPFSFIGGDAGAGDADPMQLMQQAFMLQMRIARSMCMMPITMMQGFAEMLGGHETAPAQGGFKLGKFEIPPELLQMVLQMDMKPENLEKLQKVLDFVFSVMPEPKSDDE